MEKSNLINPIINGNKVKKLKEHRAKNWKAMGMHPGKNPIAR